MKEIYDNAVRTYAVKDDFIVDIVNNKQDGTYEAWLYKQNICFKSFMFGFLFIQHNPDGTQYTTSYDEFVEMVKKNIDDYIPIYLDELETLENAVREEFYR